MWWTSLRTKSDSKVV